MRIQLAAIVLLAALGSALPASGQAAADRDSTALHAAIAVRDSALFDAFNR